ncbi:nitrate/nitrite transporter NrtS [Labilibacter marinus]|nr:nitrate/nitrite transporter NrtS [Labilibacter marinus]
MRGIFFSRKVVLTELKMSFIVGSILALINHGGAIVKFTLPARQTV